MDIAEYASHISGILLARIRRVDRGC
jgi:hypothetical protein